MVAKESVMSGEVLTYIHSYPGGPTPVDVTLAEALRPGA
jgi:hypothetical protein